MVVTSHISTGSRIHICLLEMNGDLGRRNGSVGLSLDYPAWEIEATTCFDSDEVAWCAPFETREKEVTEICSRFREHLQIDTHFSLKISGGIPKHTGLGSTTKLYCGVVHALSHTINKEMETQDVAQICLRGGTSGIGVLSFESGGLMIDGGHIINEPKVSWTPSEFAKVTHAPSIIAGCDFIFKEVLFLVPPINQKTPIEELEFFKRTCPIAREQVGMLCRTVFMHLLPSCIEGDQGGICDAIEEVQGLGFKRLEIESYAGQIEAVFHELRALGGKGIGMSSFGPGVYVCNGPFERIEEWARENNFRHIYRAKVST